MADPTYVLVPGAGGVAAYWRPVADELSHRDTALEHEAEKAAGYRAMKGAIKRGVKTAIWLAERI